MENNNQNLTVWQKLAKTFGPDGTLGQDQPDYKLDKKEILQSNMPLSDDVRLAVMNSTLPYWIKMILVADEGRTPLEGLRQEIEGKQNTLIMLETELINNYIDSSYVQSGSWTNSRPKARCACFL